MTKTTRPRESVCPGAGLAVATTDHRHRDGSHPQFWRGEAPSARELTRALGITAPSLYRHFSSTDELADALCARYFEQLGRHCSGLRSTCPRRWSACTHSDWPMCVMLRSIRCGTASRRPILHASGRNPMKYSAAQPFCICGTSFKSWLTRRFPRGNTLGSALQLWATTHGVASLLVTRPYLPWGEQESFASRTLRAAYLGQVMTAGPESADGDGK